jgi:hypothetical protein
MRHRTWVRPGRVLRSATVSDTSTESLLSEDDERLLIAQFVDALTHAEDSYDESLRILAGGGVAVTVSIATALHALSGAGVWAIVAFLASLGLTLASHQTSRQDMTCRINKLNARTYDPTHLSGWTRATAGLNLLAGAALIAGGILLALFVPGV